MERIVRSWMHSETQTVAAALRTRIYSSSSGEDFASRSRDSVKRR